MLLVVYIQIKSRKLAVSVESSTVQYYRYYRSASRILIFLSRKRKILRTENNCNLIVCERKRSTRPP